MGTSHKHLCIFYSFKMFFICTILNRTCCCISMALHSIFILLTAIYAGQQYKYYWVSIVIILKPTMCKSYFILLTGITQQYTVTHCYISVTTMVMQTCHNVTLYMHCLSCQELWFFFRSTFSVFSVMFVYSSHNG